MAPDGTASELRGLGSLANPTTYDFVLAECGQLPLPLTNKKANKWSSDRPLLLPWPTRLARSPDYSLLFQSIAASESDFDKKLRILSAQSPSMLVLVSHMTAPMTAKGRHFFSFALPWALKRTLCDMF
jgi:hypothetical protein